MREYYRRHHGTSDTGGEVNEHNRGYEAGEGIKEASQAASEPAKMTEEEFIAQGGLDDAVVKWVEEHGVSESVLQEFQKEENDMVKRTFDNETFNVDGIVFVETESGQEFGIAKDEEKADEMATEMVKNDLETEPSLFNQDWLEGFFDTDQFLDEVDSDVDNMDFEDVKEDPESFGLSQKDVDEETDAFTEAWEKHHEEHMEEIRGDPIGYLKDLGIDDKIIDYIDIDEAAEDAIGVDGPGHFLSSYDGNIRDLPSGAVYWRIN